MKIRGRFIGILAVLGLLIALVPLASAGAVAGEVKLTGGEKGQYFSDQTDDNIVTIQIKDADLTPLRKGTARLENTTGDDSLDLTAYFVAGEKEATEMFDGGVNNPVCDHDGDSSNDDQRRDPDNIHTDEPDTGCDYGDAMELTGPDADIDADEDTTDGDESADNLFMFTLKGVGRDRQNNSQTGVGAIGPNDIISVVVNGRTAAASTDNISAPANVGSGPWYTVAAGGDQAEDNSGQRGTPEITAVDGMGVKGVVIHNLKPQDAANSVSITYTDTEFDFSSDTPLDLEETRVRYAGSSGSTDYKTVDSQVSVNLTQGAIVTVASNVTGHTIVSFAYDVKDSYVISKSMVTLNSTSAGDVRLAIAETSANSDTFEARVAVFNQDDYSLITTQVRNNDNLGTDDETAAMDDKGVVNVDELNATNGLSPADEAGNSSSLAERVTRAAEKLFPDKDLSTVKASDFEALAIRARHGDIINVTYQDANPSASVSKTATVDLEAPVVTLVSPVQNFFTNVASVTMSAEVTDADAGVDPTNIELKIDIGTTGLARAAAVETPIENGYRVTAASQGSISEGKKEWFVGVRDKVGNVPDRDVQGTDEPEDCGEEGNDPCGDGPEGVNEAPRGAASNTAAEADNPFAFTVDTRAPTLTGGKTGISLKNPGVTSGANKETERKNQNTWVRVTFNTGEGKAPLDASTVTSSDFHVDGAVPLDVKINSVTHKDGTESIAKGTAVYLQVGQLDSDERPEVELVGEVSDRAGNEREGGKIANANDGLAPALTVTPSAKIAKDEVTITITSTENLRTNPTVELTETKPVKPGKGESLTLVNAVIRPASLQPGSLTTWTATFKNASGQASKQYVVVAGSDAADNTAMEGGAADDEDFISFQVDAAAPKLRFVDATGKDLENTKQEEGAVWIVAEFDEDEGMVEDGKTNDSYRKVEVTSMTLMNKDTEDVVTEDVTQVFDSEADCVDHDTDNVRYDKDTKNNKCALRTLAVSLTPGMYNIKVVGVDQSGNDVTGNTDFEVTAAKPFELTLRPGQNFISIPGMPMDDGGNIDTLFSDAAIEAVSTYDRSRELAGENPWLRSSKDLETGMFSGDITAIEPGKAYFVNSKASVIVKVKLQAAGQLPPTIPVRQGFNAIGFWSVSGAEDAEIDLYFGSIGWSVAYSYDPTPGKGWEVIRKGETDAAGDPLDIEGGRGYLVYALYDSVLTP